jgi:hypothetical protein
MKLKEGPLYTPAPAIGYEGALPAIAIPYGSLDLSWDVA